MKKVKRALDIIVILTLLIGGNVLFFTSTSPAAANTENPYLVNTFVDEDGRQIDVVIVPGRPPEIKATVATVPEPDIRTETGALSEVPAFDWSYGCSPTSAAMLFGYYDRTGYSDMYTGPTNGGVCPLDNSIWGPGIGGSDGECPLSATHNGKDGRTTRGNVDDYWISYLDPGPDPWIVNGWGEHTYGDCTGDFMGTSQSAFINVDGSTTLGYYTHGSPRVDLDDGDLILEVTATGDMAGATTVEVPFACNIIGDIDGNGGAEPTDVSLLINKLNGLGNGGYHDKAFDLDANGGAEPGDVSILLNVLNGVL